MYAGEIKRVPRKAGVQLQPSNKGGNGGLAQTCYTTTERSRKQGRNCNFLTEGKDVARAESRSRSLGGKLVVMEEMKNTTTLATQPKLKRLLNDCIYHHILIINFSFFAAHMLTDNSGDCKFKVWLQWKYESKFNPVTFCKNLKKCNIFTACLPLS